jgi:hypothetical protein
VVVFLANGYYFQIQNAQASEAPHGFDGFERGPIHESRRRVQRDDNQTSTAIPDFPTNGISGITTSRHRHN